MTLSKSSDISGLWFSWAEKDKMVWCLRFLKLTGVGYERLEWERSTYRADWRWRTVIRSPEEEWKERRGKSGFKRLPTATKVTQPRFVYTASTWPWLILEGSDWHYIVSPYAGASRNSTQMQAPGLLWAKLPQHSHPAKPRSQTSSWWANGVTPRETSNSGPT